MKSLKLPALDGYRDLIASCASSYAQERTRSRKERILDSIDALVDSGDSYNKLAITGSLGEIAESSICGVAEKDDLIDLYEAKLVKGKAEEQGRKVYNDIKDSAPLGICPLCSQLPVAMLDHYLPKSKYPAYSIFPANLVPSCHRCNLIKLSKANDLTLHPYYDDIEDIEWLECSMRIDDGAIVLEYCVRGDVSLGTARERMVNHLKDVGVAELYQASASSHLIEIRESLMRLGSKGGPVSVREYLLEGLSTRKHASLNSWGTALYTEMCSCQWFINGGYAKIEAA
jgi:hypothetical protein